jgi:hypothetical protein
MSGWESELFSKSITNKKYLFAGFNALNASEDYSTSYSC